jgi:hypothetical protein
VHLLVKRSKVLSTLSQAAYVYKYVTIGTISNEPFDAAITLLCRNADPAQAIG